MEKHVELDPAVCVDIDSVSKAHLLGLDPARLGCRDLGEVSAEVAVPIHLQCFGPFQEILEVEVYHVVTHQEVRIIGDNQLLEVLKELFFCLHVLDVGSRNGSCSIENEYHFIVEQF